jgi:hypothetical protein
MLLHMEIRLLLLKLSGWCDAVVKSIEHVKIFCNMHLTFLKILNLVITCEGFFFSKDSEMLRE